jgi:hypothetical protein
MARAMVSGSADASNNRAVGGIATLLNPTKRCWGRLGESAGLIAPSAKAIVLDVPSRMSSMLLHVCMPKTPDVGTLARLEIERSLFV